MRTPVHDFLTEYAERGFQRCHTPGHRGAEPLDITEIFGADSLYDCGGIILESERNAAMLFGADDTLFSCGGSTLAIQAMLAAVKITSNSKTPSVTAGRFAHRSLVASAALLGLDIDWVYPDEYLSCTIDATKTNSAIHSDTAAVFAASVDYYGGMSDIAGLAGVAKNKGIHLIVDNAHGAYLVFTDSHPIKNGAAMTADSAHKTLPALTGAAYLHINKPFERILLKKAMALFGSTSPSYLMLDSLDCCNEFIYKHKNTACDALKAVSELKMKLARLGCSLRKSDAMRITVRTDRAAELSAYLREKRIECELADDNNVVLLFSVICTKADCDEIYGRMAEIKAEHGEVFAFSEKRTGVILKPKKAVSPRLAIFGKTKKIPLAEAVGAVCAEIIAPCPPGVPLVMPGEIYDETSVEVLMSLGVKDSFVLI